MNSASRRRRSWRRRVGLPAALTGLASAAALVGAPVALAVDRGTFELDGNAVASGTLAGDDWSAALAGLPTFAPGSSHLADTGVVPDPLNTTIFTGGGSKDDLDIRSWRHTNGSVPDKDEITNAYAAAYNKNGDLVVYFGADRYATNGNAALGFWFFQDDVAPRDGGTFAGSHVPAARTEPRAPGDLLILSNFTNGGSQPTIQVYEWVPGGPVNGTLKLLTDSGSTCNAAQASTAAEPLACAIVNTATVPSPWPYTPKSGPADQLAKGAFFEGGVNVTQLYRAAGDSVPCFTSFLAETRSSQSVDATLKDFVAGDFDLCDAKITIAGSGVNEVGQQHVFTAKVEKIAAGVSTPVQGAKPVVTLTPSGGASPTVLSDTCASAGTNSSGECSVTFNSSSAGLVLGSATVTFQSGGQTYTRATGTTATGANPAAVKRYVDARISIDPPLDTNGITEMHTFTVKVEQDDGYPAGSPGDAVSGFGPAPTGTKPAVTLTESRGAVVSDKTDSCAATGTDAAGECTVVFTSNSAGTVVGAASVTLSFTGLPAPGTVTRTTDGTAASSGTAVKHFVEGTLAWLKHDQSGALLGGATFEVCRTTSYDSATGTHTALATPLCVSVTDDKAPDVDATAGQVKLEKLVMGTYTVRETAAPPGYSFDPQDERTVKVETTAPDVTISRPFVNTQLYKLIVLTCNQVTGELVQSTVTLNNLQKDTITAPAGAADLCKTGGASYGDLPRGTYNPSVVIPRAAG